jgi:beta-galactosidase
VGLLEREFPNRSLSLSIPAGGARLDVLVENMGRVNFGPHLLDRKGITRGVALGGKLLFDWEIFPLPLEHPENLTFRPGRPSSLPAFFRGKFQVEAPADTFLSMPGWTKGNAWVNGVHLGRYWKRGPQRTLYVPAPFLHKGGNEITLMELHGLELPSIQFVDRSRLG